MLTKRPENPAKELMEVARHRKSRVIEYDNAKVLADIAEGQALMRYGWSAEKFALRAQRELRALGGTQEDAEALARITDDGGDGHEARPVTGLMRAGVARILEHAASRQLVGVAA
jgi:hypothetical protein